MQIHIVCMYIRISIKKQGNDTAQRSGHSSMGYGSRVRTPQRGQ